MLYFYYTVDRLQSTKQTRSQTQTGHQTMHIIQLQTKPQNSRKTGVKHQIKCTINWTLKQWQGRRGRSDHTLVHHSATTVKSEHFTTVKRHSVTASTHHSCAPSMHHSALIIIQITENFSKIIVDKHHIIVVQ